MGISRKIGWGKINDLLWVISNKLTRLTDVTSKIVEYDRWDDLRAPATGINPAGQISPPTVNPVDGSLLFAVNDAVVVWFQLPHAWHQGTNIKPHIHWAKTTSVVGTVNWQMKYKWFNIGDVDPGFSSLVSGVEAVPNSDTADKQALLRFAELDGSDKLISSMLCIYLVRTATGDTYPEDVKLYEVDIHHMIDSNGSVYEFIKD